ncbi:transglycosylase SLT domain-containing protein [Paraburkholderia rhizosphaerae]|nr:transglycosylase SLT domain-containing protein [Paraburkholderia rhizosphaerae]
MTASTTWRRLLCIGALWLGLMQIAWAQQSGNARTQSDVATSALAADLTAASNPSPDSVHATSDHVSDYLAKKFGVAKEKAVQISNAVRVASEKYALPPALLLAIISIESRFKEKAKGRNGATGLMQVVPSAHRPLLKNVKDLTEPVTNIEIGSAILYGYAKSAGGDLNAALKSYGGSKAYADMVSLRARTFAPVVEPQDGTAVTSPSIRADACDARWTTFCIRPIAWPGPTADLTESASDPTAPQAMPLPGVLLPLLR